MSKGLGMASFLAGMGTGYLKAKDKEYERERQAKEDAWREEQRSRQRTEWQDADNLKSSLKAAANPVSTGAVVTDDAGSNAFTKDADAAAMMADMSNTKNAGMNVQQATRVGDTAYTDPTKAAEAATMAAKPEAYNQRMVQALRSEGQVERAATMEATALDQQAKRLGLDVAQYKFADEMTNRQMSQALAAGPTWYEGAAKFITDSQYPGIKEMKAEAVLSPDGKAVSMFAVMPDGSKKLAGTYPTDETGQQQFMDKFSKIPLEKRMEIMHEREKAKQDQSNSDRDFDLRKKESESAQQYRDRTLRIQEAQSARAGAAHSATMADAKIPPAVKLSAQALADQIKSVDGALNKAMAEGMFDPESPGAQKLQEQRAALGIQYSRLLAPYIPSEKGQTGDVLGLNTPAPAAAKPAAAAPPAVKRPAYDPALKTVVDAMAQPPKPVATGAGSIDHMRRAFQKNTATAGRN